MVVTLPNAGRVTVGGGREVPDVVRMRPEDLFLVDAAVGIVGFAMGADRLFFFEVRARVVQAVDAHVTIISISTSESFWVKFDFQTLSI